MSADPQPELFDGTFDDREAGERLCVRGGVVLATVPANAIGDGPLAKLFDMTGEFGTRAAPPFWLVAQRAANHRDAQEGTCKHYS
ncbi:hypothetical protein ACQQ2N_12310 [Dokdonella sp. MW10]|uniref:hypothetical protein n=1 Tax=Dokdonella sp. MW10 TaxID=2992926 RepID=UPI003F805297